MKKLIIPAIAVALTTGAAAPALTTHPVNVASAKMPAATNTPRNYGSVLARSGCCDLMVVYVKPSFYQSVDLDK